MGKSLAEEEDSPVDSLVDSPVDSHSFVEAQTAAAVNLHHDKNIQHTHNLMHYNYWFTIYHYLTKIY